MRESLDFGGVAMLRVADLSEVHRQDLDSVDMVIVRDKALQEGWVQSPRVEWFMPVMHSTLVEHFSGNHRRKLKRSYEQLNVLDIMLRLIPNVNQAEFDRFLSIYREVIGAKEHPRLRLSEESFETLRKEAPLLGVFAYRGDECIGGTLVRDYTDFYALSYSAYPQFSRKELEVGLGVLLFDLVYQHSATQKRTRVSYGRDTNMYGYHLSVGLLEYKLSIGCSPEPFDLEGISQQTVFIMRPPSQGTVATYTKGSDQDLLLAVASSIDSAQLRQYFSHSAEAHEQSDLTTVIERHRAYVESVCAS